MYVYIYIHAHIYTYIYTIYVHIKKRTPLLFDTIKGRKKKKQYDVREFSLENVRRTS